MDYRYVFFTSNINNPILDGYKSDIADLISLDLGALQKGQEFNIEDSNYRIVDVYRTETTSPVNEAGFNIYCEQIQLD